MIGIKKVSTPIEDEGRIFNSTTATFDKRTNTYSANIIEGLIDGASIALSIDSSTYVMTLQLKNSAGTVLSTGTIDLPLETMVVGASYDSTTKEIVLTLKSGATTRFSVADLVSGLQSEITSTNKLSSDLVDDTNHTNKFVTELEKTSWNNKSNFSGSYNDLTDKPTIPDELADLTDDSTHRLVTDTEKSTWNSKQSALTFDSTPTANSTNPVTSGGVKTYVDNQVGNISTVLESLVTVGGGS